MAARSVPSFVPALRGCVNILPENIERDWGWVPAGTATASEMIVQEPIIQEFIFDSCKISDIFIVETKKLEDHMVYVIQVTVGDCQWLVTRRYRQFAELHELLVKYYDMEKKLLPPKKTFRSKTEHYTSMRKVKLEQYLKELVKILVVPPLELLNFLNYPLYDVISVTQTLSSMLCGQGDVILTSSGYISLTPVQVYCIQRRLQIPMETNCVHVHNENDISQLYDFLYQLQKLKVKIAPTLNQTVTLTTDVIIDLTPFKSLISLRLEAVEVEQCNGLELLYTQLNCLEVYRCKSSLLWEFLVVDEEPSNDVERTNNDVVGEQPSYDVSGSDDGDDDDDDDDDELTESLIKRSSKWPRLTQLVFKYNNLEKIDESIKLAPCLEELDLSHNAISLVENLIDLTELKVLDLSHNQISRVDQLGSKLGNISKLSLAHNQITSLEGFKKLFSLVYLNLSHNSMANIREVEHLSALDCLEQLFLKGNSLTQINDYRIRVFSLLPKTWKQLSLDGVEATTEEQDSVDGQLTGDDIKDDTIDTQQSLLVSPQHHKKSPTRNKKLRPLSDVDCVSLSRAAALKNKMEAMRREGGDKWLTMFNVEREQQLFKVSPHKKRKSKSSKKKLRESNSWIKNDTEAPSSPPTPPPPIFQKCSLQKPMLGSDVLSKFFNKQSAIADEILLYIEWCSCVQWSSPDYDKDVGVFVTNKSVHILWITDTYKSSYSWENDKLPLVPLHSIPFTKLRQVVVGLFKQSLRLETSKLEDVIVLFTHNVEHTTSFAETVKAAMDAENIKYNVFTTTELEQQRITGDDCTFVVLDEVDESALKTQLVQEEVVDSQLATCYSTISSTGESLQTKILATADTTTVHGYFIVSLMQMVNEQFYYRTLIITDKKIIMCDEDHLHWPPPLSMTVIPTTNKIQVLRAELLSDISKLELCPEPQLVRGVREHIYEVFLLFTHVGEFGEKSQTSWYFCLQGSAQLEQFISIMESNSVTVHNTSGSIWPQLSSRNLTFDLRDFLPVSSTKTKTSSNTKSSIDVIENLADVSYEKQQEYFNKHVSQFPNQENIKLTFSCSCIPFTTPNLNLQVFVYVSSRAVYLLTDADSMQQWVNGGGKCPFASRSYSDLQRSNLCFQYVTFQQLRDVCVGLFYQYVRISGSDPSSTFTFMTQNFDLTDSLLEALPRCDQNFEDSLDDSFTKLITQYSFRKTDKGRPYSTPLPNSNDGIHFKTTYQEPNPLLSILGESQSEPVMILKYMVVRVKDDVTDIVCSMVLTNHNLYVINEDFVHWPTPPFTCLPSQPRYSVYRSCALHDIVRVETKRRETSDFTVVCLGSELKLPNQLPSEELSDDDSLVSELMQTIEIDKEVKRLSHMATASRSAIRGLTTWCVSVQSYEDRERFLQVLATAYEDVKKEKLLVTAT